MLKNILEIWETLIQNTLHNFTYNYIAFKKMGLPDITGDLFTSYEQFFYPFINLKTVNLIAANIPYDTLYHRTCFYSS